MCTLMACYFRRSKTKIILPMMTFVLRQPVSYQLYEQMVTQKTKDDNYYDADDELWF